MPRAIAATLLRRSRQPLFYALMGRAEIEIACQRTRPFRRERSARKITQEKLAELADLNIRTVQKSKRES